MPKITDIKAYYRDLAAKAGLDEDTIKQVLTTFDNDKFAKAFTDGFKPLPDYSHDLDDVRTRTKAEKDKEYLDWHEKEKVKFNEYVSVLDEHKKYKDTFGPLDNPSLTPNLNSDNNGGGTKPMTKEEMTALLDARMNETLTRRDSAVLDLLEIRETHLGTFKKPLNVKEFESAWKEHPEWGGQMKLAYSQYVSPELDKVKDAQIKADNDRRYEEGVRDGYSRRATPTDHQPKTFSPLFDRKEDVSKLNENEQEKHSREAFFEGLRDTKQPA